MALFTDTSTDAEALQLELFRKASLAKRFALMSSYSSTLRRASLRQLEQRFSDSRKARLEWMRLHYDETVINNIKDKIQVSRSTVNETEGALQLLVEAFTQLAIPYRIVGSVASSAQGMVQATLGVDVVATLGVDVVATLESRHIPQLASRLKPHYHLDEDLALEAIKRGSSFNLIHIDTMIKIDIFILGKRPYDKISFERERLEMLDDLTLSFKTPEDVILGKLEWFVQTDKTSERQWRDVIGLLKVQGGLLDFAYMRQWAQELGVDDLLGRAFTEADSS
jgi:hypothetical protein